MSKLLFTIGLPRSGKSTYLKNTDKRYSIVCADEIRLALYGQRYFAGGELFVSAIKEIMIKSLLSNGNDIIVDGTHTTQNSINKILSIDNEANGIFIPTHPDICKQRAIETEQLDLIPIIDKMVQNLKELPQSLKDKFNIKADWLK